MTLPHSVRLLFITALAALSSVVALGVRTAPSVAQAVNPDYPAELKKAGVEGKAVLKVAISESGEVSSVEVVSADKPEFGDAAVAAVKRWKFNPAKDGDKPVAIKVNLPVVFSIPPEEKLNIVFGREVFKDITAEVFSENDLESLLQVVTPPVAFWPANLEGDPEASEVHVSLIVGPTGETFNPEIRGTIPNELIVPTLRAVAKMKYAPPMKNGAAVHVATDAIVMFTASTPPPSGG